MGRNAQYMVKGSSWASSFTPSQTHFQDQIEQHQGQGGPVEGRTVRSYPVHSFRDITQRVLMPGILKAGC